jgi:hypothetical protein
MSVSVASTTTAAATIDTTTSSTATTIKTSVTLPHTRSRTHTQARVAPPPATGPRVPATFTVAAGGTLTPPEISVPVHYRVELTFLDHGGAVAVRVLTPHPVTLNVPAGGEASKVISGLPKGTYPIAVNGATRGSLVIGSAPGP